MKKLKAFIYVFSKSLTSPAYYKDVVKADTRLSLKYFFTLALFASVIVSIYVLVPLVPKVRSALEDGVTHALMLYPDDLVIEATDGEVFINYPDPFIVPAPKTEHTLFENIIVYDSDGTVDDLFSTYKSLALVNRTNIMFQEGTGSVKVESFADLPNGTFTKADLLNITSLVESLIAYIPYILSVLLFLVIAFYYFVFRLLYLFIVATAFFVIGNIKGLRLTFRQYYRIAIHTFTLPLVFELVRVLARLNVQMPLWFFVLNVLFGVVVLFSLDSKEASKN